MHLRWPALSYTILVSSLQTKTLFGAVLFFYQTALTISW